MQKPTNARPARTARTALIALPVAGALLLAGCSGDSMPGALNSATPTGPLATSSPTTSVPTPTAPKTQDPNSDAALIAATLAYIEASEKAALSLKTGELRKTFAKGCIVCERDVARVESWAKSGYSVVGAGAKWTTPTIASRNANGVTIMRVMASTKPGVLRDASGRTIQEFSAVPPKPVHFLVRRIKGQPIVVGIST